MLTVILTLIISALSVFGLYCLLCTIMGLRTKNEYVIAVRMGQDVYQALVAAKRAEMIFDGNRHIATPPVILVKNQKEAGLLRSAQGLCDYEIYVREGVYCDGNRQGDC